MVVVVCGGLGWWLGGVVLDDEGGLMDIQQIAIFVGQWLLVELSKRIPKVGEWIKANAPAIVVIMAGITSFLQALFNVPSAVAQAVSDSLPVAAVVPVYVASGFSGFLSNALNLILADNLIRKILWHYVIGRVLKVPMAQEDRVKVGSPRKR